MAKKQAVGGRRVGLVRGADVAAELARYYETGCTLKTALGIGRRFGEKLPVEAATREKLMQQHGISLDQFYKTLDFACLYTRREFTDLQTRTSAVTNEPLHWAHVRALFAFTRDQVPERTALEIKAIQQNWSVRQLLREVRQQPDGQKKRRGRRCQYKDVLSWAEQTERYLAGLFEDANPDANDGPLVIDEVLAANSRSRTELSALAESIREYADAFADRTARSKNRRSRRS